MVLSPSTAARLATQLDSLLIVLDKAIPAALQQRSPAGKWSAHENLAHLARYHEVFLERLQRILREDKPRLPRYRPEDDPKFAAWAALSTEEALTRLRGLRTELLERVHRLSEPELARVGVHPVFGEMTIPEWIEFFLLHEAHHLYAVMRRLHGAD